MSNELFKFPSTPHLTALAGLELRGDKQLSASERDVLLQHEVLVEEKVDGANLGISFDSGGNIHVQNRGAYLHLPGMGQWKKLAEWLAPRTGILFEHLAGQYILFGEWCYAQHSVFYDRLPDWFLGFDVYDRHVGRFWSATRRDDLFAALRIATVPCIASGRFTFLQLQALLPQSKISDQPAEGLYLRLEEGEWLKQRAKLVRPAFIQSIDQHWSDLPIRPNRLRIC